MVRETGERPIIIKAPGKHDVRIRIPSTRRTPRQDHPSPEFEAYLRQSHADRETFRTMTDFTPLVNAIRRFARNLPSTLF